MTTHQAPHQQQFQQQQQPVAMPNRAPSTGQMQHPTGPPLSANFSDHRQAPIGMQHHQQEYRRNVGGGHPQRPFTRESSLPLRIVVNSRYVGAIIGQGGATISDLSRESGARCVIDQQRNRNVAVADPTSMEKIISIYGSLDACSKACVKILEIVRREMEKDHTATDEHELKIRALNELVGRLIGKSGKTIKSIKTDTGAYVSVSNASCSDPGNIYDLGATQPYSGYVVERSITVRARDLEAVSRAEHMISSNLRKSFETDGQKMYNAGAFGGLPIAPYLGVPGQSGVPHPGFFGNYPLTGQSRSVKLFVPNSVIGALIGSKGAYIKKMIQNTGAQIRIDNSDYNRVKRNTISSSEGDPRPSHPEAPEEEQKVPAPEKETDQEKNLEGDKQEGKSDLAVPQKSPEPEAVAESSKTPEANGGEKEAGKAPEANRLVTITGIDGQISNALYYIFDKVAEQIFSPLEELRLHSEITVPSSLVGRIIGKSGQNVRELQRITQAVVKIPEDAHRSEAPVANFDEEPLSTVRIDGCCFATQAVEIRINQLVFEHRQRCLASLQRQPNCDSWQQGQPAASPRPQS